MLLVRARPRKTDHHARCSLDTTALGAHRDTGRRPIRVCSLQNLIHGNAEPGPVASAMSPTVILGVPAFPTPRARQALN